LAINLHSTQNGQFAITPVIKNMAGLYGEHHAQ
jgi:hypothetical protein